MKGADLLDRAYKQQKGGKQMKATKYHNTYKCVGSFTIYKNGKEYDSEYYEIKNFIILQNINLIQKFSLKKRKSIILILDL